MPRVKGQFDRAGNIIYMLQDANYNVVALVDGGGAMLEQYTWEPYGTLVAVERQTEPGSIVAGFVNRVGHQGLFFDRFGGRYDQYSLIVRESEAGPDFATGAKGLYYNRNRFYSPRFGRYTSTDPNETALPIMTAMAMNAESLEVFQKGFNALTLYGDGSNLYQYGKSNPLRNLDPLGTFNYVDLLFTSAIQATLGAMVSGTMTQALGGNYWDGAFGGAIGGALGGGAGYLVNSFASGLVGTLIGKGLVGGADGFIGGFAQSYYDQRDLKYAIVDGLYAGVIGAATGGLVDWTGRILRGVAPKKAYRILSLIRTTGSAPPGYKGGRTFHNHEGILPPGKYREFDIDPQIPFTKRNAERIVVDQSSGRAYYTPDHYKTFVEM